MIFNCYDPNLSYPQPARFGLGTIIKGIHTPPAGLVGHEVTQFLSAGVDERFYQTTAADTIIPKSQAEIDAIIQAETDLNDKFRQRIIKAMDRLESILKTDQARSIKTRANCLSYVQSVGAEQGAADALFIALQDARLQVAVTKDTLFPGDE